MKTDREKLMEIFGDWNQLNTGQEFFSVGSLVFKFDNRGMLISVVTNSGIDMHSPKRDPAHLQP